MSRVTGHVSLKARKRGAVFYLKYRLEGSTPGAEAPRAGVD